MDPLVVGENLTKAYGPTVAVNSVSFAIRRGAITALLGGNGAGKSTLTRLWSGTTHPDEGTLTFDSHPIADAGYSVRKAKNLGIRVVHQELSVCTNLNAAENLFLELSAHLAVGSWRRKASRLVEETLETVFPGNRVRGSSNIGALTLAQQQMVEIARAAADPKLKLLILDEPTSSLDAARSHQLLEYLRHRAQAGLSVVFIGHKLGEILDLADDFLVMRDGRLVWSGPRAETDHEKLVILLSARAPGIEKTGPVIGLSAGDSPPGASREAALVEVAGRWREKPELGAVKLFRGEIVGLAGLEGSGQQPLLLDMHGASARPQAKVTRRAQVAYVTGDRRKEGVFPLWTTMQNMTIARNARRSILQAVSTSVEKEWTAPWRERFSFTASAMERPILQLSGGNQQKALMSRALIDQADVVLLNDPTRGVDIGVKREFYQVLRDVARSGKLIVWYSSEDAEFLECSRVLVLRRGKIAAEISGPEATRESLTSAFFGSSETRAEVGEPQPAARRAMPGWLVPLAALTIVLAAIGLFNPRALSPFGLGLLLSTAVPLVLVSFGQMFVVARSEIDLGIGAFAGLINVISATLLVDKPFLGTAALAAGLVAYGLLGWVIYVRKIPALVATLGSAFVWTGLGYVLQPAPGGSSPEWLTAAFNMPIPWVPPPIWILLIAALAAVLVTRSRLGIVLRGFGNNETAMRQLGWPPVRSHVITYLLSAIFGLAAGLCLTGVNTASDINAASSYTLLSVAAVVMGGCDLVGGRVEPVGVVFAAVTLSLLGTLLGFMRLSSDNIAAVQGFILIGIVVLRTVWARAR
ncbi:MAG TPA: ATP-binding cassette domain-containing protein [Chthoniobacterales bacterium]